MFPKACNTAVALGRAVLHSMAYTCPILQNSSNSSPFIETRLGEFSFRTLCYSLCWKWFNILGCMFVKRVFEFCLRCSIYPFYDLNILTNIESKCYECASGPNLMFGKKTVSLETRSMSLVKIQSWMRSCTEWKHGLKKDAVGINWAFKALRPWLGNELHYIYIGNICMRWMTEP